MILLFLKKIFSQYLLLCFIATLIHSHPLDHHFNEQNSQQIIDKQNDEFHHVSKECQKCLIKNNKSELLCTVIELFKASPVLLKNKSESFTKYNNHFNIYCRPPPLIVS